METNKKNIPDNEDLSLVFHKMLEEQRQTNKTLVNVVTTQNHLSGKINKFEERLSELSVDTPAIDTSEIKDIVTKGMLNTAMMLERHQSKNVRSFQILLFPPQDARLFYKIVFGRWFLYALLGFIVYRIYLFAIHQSDNNMKAKIEIERIKSDHKIKAWDYLYRQKDKKLHRLMDSALVKYGF